MHNGKGGKGGAGGKSGLFFGSDGQPGQPGEGKNGGAGGKGGEGGKGPVVSFFDFITGIAPHRTKLFFQDNAQSLDQPDGLQNSISSELPQDTFD